MENVEKVICLLLSNLTGMTPDMVDLQRLTFGHNDYIIVMYLEACC